jgi:hypothetical protein
LTCGVETSTHLCEWVTLAEVTLQEASALITHTNAATEPVRFYRARILSGD